MASAEDGLVYTWGWPASGRLGHSFASSPEEEQQEEALEQRSVWEPRLVELLKSVKVKQASICEGMVGWGRVGVRV